MTATAVKAPWPPNTRVALAINAAAIADVVMAAALAATFARAFRRRRPH